MFNLNQVILIGNAGSDAKLVNKEGLTPVAKFRVATTGISHKDNEKKEFTEWHNIVVLGNNALNVAKYVKKGMIIAIEGSLQTRPYKDLNGNSYFKTEIIAKNISWLKPISDKTKIEENLLEAESIED